jgi:hypothetical protein
MNKTLWAALALRSKLALNSGSSALLMKADRLGLWTVEKSPEKEDASAGWHPSIIKSAGDPEFPIGISGIAKAAGE